MQKQTDKPTNKQTNKKQKQNKTEQQINVWLFLRNGSFYEELSFPHYLQHYSGSTQTTDIGK